MSLSGRARMPLYGAGTDPAVAAQLADALGGAAPLRLLCGSGGKGASDPSGGPMLGAAVGAGAFRLPHAPRAVSLPPGNCTDLQASLGDNG
jgi:hypothetical protein